MDEDINYNFLCYLGRKVHNDEIEAIYALTILVIPEIKKTLFRKKFLYKCNNCKTTNKFLWCLDNKGKKIYLERKNSPNTRFKADIADKPCFRLSEF